MRTGGAVPSTNGFLDFAEVASLYSQLAGVLAGFAFAALIAVATVRLGDGSSERYVTSAYRPLMCSFFSLVAASLNYAIVAGDPERTGRSAAVEATAGVSFCSAGCLLIFSIFVTLDSVEAANPDTTGVASKAVRLVRRMLAVTVPPLFVLLFLPALRDHSAVKYGNPFSSTPLNVLALVVVGVTLVLSLAIAGSFKWLTTYRSRVDLLSVPGVSVAILATLVTGGFIAFMDRTSFLPDVVPISELLLVAGLGIVTSVAACRFQSEEQGHQSFARIRAGSKASREAAGAPGVTDEAVPRPRESTSFVDPSTESPVPQDDGPPPS